jgi:hypothetical protein
MVLVVLAALNFAVIRAALDIPSTFIALSAWGAMPMATVLAIGFIIGCRSHGSRPFLRGFEAFGVLALALFVVLALFFGPNVVGPYVTRFISPLVGIIGWDRPFILISIEYLVAVVALGLPQVAFALIGGFLSRRYWSTMTKRPARLPTER